MNTTRQRKNCWVVSEVVGKFHHNGKTMEICRDNWASDPRGEHNLGIMICFHKRHALGDSHNLSIEEAKELENSADVIALPVYLYDHSGLSVQTTPFSCTWDSGRLGFIYATKENVRNEFGWKNLTTERQNKIREYLRNEVDTYNSYLCGDMYAYTVTDASGTITDAGGGFCGSDWDTNGLFECSGTKQWSEM